ncbi:nicotinamide riboside transporter PnuC [Chitinophaga nivalis]|uniref:Nicotinamide riboside transporter PnuC n=1 Tax=Chitinophaga nivalis TaxID=2991709 RepID=A0ABT3ISZ7_9BACT|nr:nicotinamide riboside transporter PnuC [Chitinophaga nivalis]MCW3463207.1 nicotinamide riboside transporter PnuC [Chitinophaga nivalis]MCW3487103.1 nicotinamide riboside transporter PnuC [Chitinophaga nivalis]
MTAFFSITHYFFSIGGYAVSYIEFIGTVTGLLCVWLAARDHIFTWPVGLMNVSCFFILFWQLQLYADMFLQLYFFATGVYGWIFWLRKQPEQEPVYALSRQQRWWLGIAAVILSALTGWVISQVHNWWPQTFRQPAAYPYVDSIVAVLSVIANILLAKRIWENWLLWVIVDVIATMIYVKKDVLFLGAEYFILLIIAAAGLLKWYRSYRQQWQSIQQP